MGEEVFHFIFRRSWIQALALKKREEKILSNVAKTLGS